MSTTVCEGLAACVAQVMDARRKAETQEAHQALNRIFESELWSAFGELEEEIASDRAATHEALTTAGLYAVFQLIQYMQSFARPVLKRPLQHQLA